MRRIRGLRLRHKLVKVFKWILRKRTPAGYRRSSAFTAVSKVCNWVSSLKQGTFGLCFSKLNLAYIRVGEEPKPAPSVPKGHLAVYVGEDEEYVHRVLVPVVYFNHPLFGDLLREAEKVYGFDHPGGIQIPCRVSEFENIRTVIAGGGHRRSWRGRYL